MTDTKDKDKKPKDSSLPFKVFDKADEDQVVTMLKGATPKDMVYSFRVGGQEINGLSAAGTLRAVKGYNIQRKKKSLPIIRINPKYNVTLETSDGVICEATAMKGKESWTGSSNQPKSFRNTPDPFYSAKARTKAQRNAFRGLLPDSLIQKLIAKWTKQEKVRRFLNDEKH